MPTLRAAESSTYYTALDAAAAAYLTASHAAEAAFLTATTAAAAASLTAVTAADAAYSTAMTAASAAYATAYTAAGAAYTAAVAASGFDASASSAAGATYAVAVGVAQATQASAVAAVAATHAADLAAAKTAVASASSAAVTVYLNASASASSACSTSVYAAATAYNANSSASALLAAQAATCPTTTGPLGAAPAIPQDEGTSGFTSGAPVSSRYLWSGAQVERAYARRNAVLDSTGRPPAALSTGVGLFPAYGFAPAASAGAWAVRALDENQSVLCVTSTATSLAEWHERVAQLSENGMRPANAECGESGAYSEPASFPRTLRSRKILDRRNYPVPTVLPDYPIFSGLTPGRALPALTLSAVVGSSGPAAILVLSNPPTALPGTVPLQYKVLTVSALLARQGFSAQHDCTLVLAGQSCSITLTYQGAARPGLQVGLLRLEFASGEFAVISLAGKTTPN